MACALPLVVPVFIPHSGCPHQCVFCNQESLTGKRKKPLSLPELRSQIDTFLGRCRQTNRRVQIAFYGGNFLGLSAVDVQALLKMATEYIDSFRAHGIRFSTRPDTINPECLTLIRNYHIDAVELGVQSMDNTVLALSRRGHTAGDTKTAVALLKAQGYQIGLQLMVGLPGDDEARAMETTRQVVALSPDFVRIYPAVVLKGSPLSRAFERGEYTPWSLERSVSLVKQMFLLFKEKKIRVIRMGLQSTVDLDSKGGILAGPYHPAFGDMVLSEIYFDKAVAAVTAAGMAAKGMRGRFLEIRIAPRFISTLRGQRNRNTRLLQEKYGLAGVEMVADPSLEEGRIIVKDRI
jgi:histone acetyltransferase (RNA polymerase elongator complex component)